MSVHKMFVFFFCITGIGLWLVKLHADCSNMIVKWRTETFVCFVPNRNHFGAAMTKMSAFKCQ